MNLKLDYYFEILKQKRPDNWKVLGLYFYSNKSKATKFFKLSNMCTHTIVCRRLLEKNQETLFKNLSDFTLIEPNTDTEQLVQESSLSFFYNLISAFHLESLVSFYVITCVKLIIWFSS